MVSHTVSMIVTAHTRGLLVGTEALTLLKLFLTLTNLWLGGSGIPSLIEYAFEERHPLALVSLLTNQLFCLCLSVSLLTKQGLRKRKYFTYPSAKKSSGSPQDKKKKIISPRKLN